MYAIPEFICLSCLVLSVLLKYLKEPCFVDKVRENLPGMECPVEQACFLPAIRLPVPDSDGPKSTFVSSNVFLFWNPSLAAHTKESTVQVRKKKEK